MKVDRTGERRYRAGKVVLATDAMARPRMLGIPGEDLPHVSHDHVARIVKAIAGRRSERLGTAPSRNNAMTWDEVKAH